MVEHLEDEKHLISSVLPPINTKAIIQKSKESVFEWKASHLLPILVMFGGFPKEEWCLPSQGSIKLNFDGSFSVTTSNFDDDIDHCRLVECGNLGDLSRVLYSSGIKDFSWKSIYV